MLQPVLLCNEVPKLHCSFPPEFRAQVSPQELLFPKRREYEHSLRLEPAYTSIDTIPLTLWTSKSCDMNVAGSYSLQPSVLAHKQVTPVWELSWLCGGVMPKALSNPRRKCCSKSSGACGHRIARCLHTLGFSSLALLIKSRRSPRDGT